MGTCQQFRWGLEGLLACWPTTVGLEVTTKGIRTGTGTKRWRKESHDGVWGCSGISWTICWTIRSRQIIITQFLQASCSFWHPTNSVKALHCRWPQPQHTDATPHYQNWLGREREEMSMTYFAVQQWAGSSYRRETYTNERRSEVDRVPSTTSPSESASSRLSMHAYKCRKRRNNRNMTMLNVTWRRFNQSAKQLIVRHTTSTNVANVEITEITGCYTPTIMNGLSSKSHTHTSAHLMDLFLGLQGEPIPER